MTRRGLWTAFVAVVALAIAASFVTQHFRDKRFDKDLSKAAVVHEEQKVQEKASAKVDVAVAKNRAEATTTLRHADELRWQADTAGQGAKTVRDSLEMWRTRDSLRTKESDSLRKVIHLDSIALDSVTRDRDRWKVQAFKADTVNLNLAKDLKLKTECQILPFVRCPTRKEAFIAGAILTPVILNNGKTAKKILSFAVPFK